MTRRLEFCEFGDNGLELTKMEVSDDDIAPHELLAKAQTEAESREHTLVACVLVTTEQVYFLLGGPHHG